MGAGSCAEAGGGDDAVRFLLFVVDELGGGGCGVGGDGGVVAVGGAVLFYYGSEVFVGVGFWVGLVGLVGRVGRVGRAGAAWVVSFAAEGGCFFFFGLVERVAFLVLAEVCRFCANCVRTIL